MDFSIGNEDELAQGEPEPDPVAPSLRLAEATVDFCREQRVPAEPPVYEVVYTHFRGDNPELSERILAELDARAITHALLLTLHEALHEGESLRGLGRIRDGLGREVDAVSEGLTGFIDAGRRSNEELRRLNSQLVDAQTRQQLRALGVRMREVGLDQVARMTRMCGTLNTALNRLAVLERELLRHSEQAKIDPLTGLPNRRWIDASLAAMFAMPADPAAPEVLILLDIDRFKSINDTFGRDVGDNILRKFAEVLCDSAGEDVSPARWEGGGFAVLVRSGGIDRAIALAENIRTTVEGFRWRCRNSGLRIGVATASAGCAIRRPADTVAEFVRRAGEALGRAKAGGRNRTYAEEDFVAAGEVVTGDTGAARSPLI